MSAPLGHEAVCSEAAQEIIKHEAVKLSRWAGFRKDEVNDLIQEITLRVIHKLPFYNPRRGHIDAFIRVTARSAAGMIARERRAEKHGVYRSHRSLELGAEVQHGDTLGAKLTPSDGARRLGIAPPPQIDLAAIKAVIDGMPEGLAAICRMLGTHTVADIARTLGMRRQRIYELMPRIREYFVEAGFEGLQDFE